MAPQEVGVELGRGDVGMAEQLLHDTKIRSSVEQVGGKRVPKGVRMDLATEVRRHGSGPNGTPCRLPSQPCAAASEEQRLMIRHRASGATR